MQIYIVLLERLRKTNCIASAFFNVNKFTVFVCLGCNFICLPSVKIQFVKTKHKGAFKNDILFLLKSFLNNISFPAL